MASISPSVASTLAQALRDRALAEQVEENQILHEQLKKAQLAGKNLDAVDSEDGGWRGDCLMHRMRSSPSSAMSDSMSSIRVNGAFSARQCFQESTWSPHG